MVVIYTIITIFININYLFITIERNDQSIHNTPKIKTNL